MYNFVYCPPLGAALGFEIRKCLKDAGADADVDVDANQLEKKMENFYDW